MRTAYACLALAVIALSAGPARSQPAQPDGEPRVVRLDEKASREVWEAAFAEAREELREARARLVVAHAAYQNMRHRRRLRGEAKKAIIDEWEAAQAALPEVEQKLQELQEAARRAGVPKGWLRQQQSAGAAASAP